MLAQAAPEPRASCQGVAQDSAGVVEQEVARDEGLVAVDGNEGTGPALAMRRGLGCRRSGYESRQQRQ